MLEKIACPSCGANLKTNNKENLSCSYCGAEVIYSESQKVTISSEIEETAKSAISFNKSLLVEIKGNRYSIADLWNSLVNDKNVTLAQLAKFYKNNRSQIVFCLECYEKLSEDIKYEIGEFIVFQMESIKKFREENNYIYLEELDTIDSYIKSLNYEKGAKGWFDFKGKKAIKIKLERVNARRTILLYDYTTKRMNAIVSKMNSMIEPLKQELNQTAKTAFARRKDLKARILLLEDQKNTEIKELNMQYITKMYNKVVKKFKIKHVDMFERTKNEQAIETNPVAEKKVVVPEVDYTKMSILELLENLLASLEKLNVGVTTGELNRYKKIVSVLEDKSYDEEGEKGLFLKSVFMTANQIYINEQPAVVAGILSRMYSSIKQNIKTAISKYKN